MWLQKPCCRGSILVALLLMLGFMTNTVNTSTDKPNYCPEKNTAANLSFTERPATLGLACLGEHTELHCCMQGYSTLHWQYKEQTTDHWVPFAEIKGKWNNRYLEEDNQTLVYEDMQQWLAGFYRCTGQDSQQHTLYPEEDIKLEARDCSDWDGPPEILEPGSDGQEFKVTLGHSDQYNCSGFFGDIIKTCPKNDPCSAYWNKVTHHNGIENYTDIYYNTTQHVYVTQEDYSISTRDNRLRLFLHINDIQASDLGEYHCILKDSVGRQSNRSIQVIEDVPLIVFNPVLKNILIALGVLLVVSVAIVTLLWRCLLEIKLLYKDRFKKPPIDDKEHDVFVIYNEEAIEDQEFARGHLCEYLAKNHNLDIKSPDNVEAGEARFCRHLEYADCCRCVVIVMSPDLLVSKECVSFFQHIVSEKYRDLIFIKFQTIPVVDWKDQHECLQAAYRVGRKVCWPDLTDNNRQKKIDKFYKKLRYELPVPQIQPMRAESEPHLTEQMDVGRETNEIDIPGADADKHLLSLDSGYAVSPPDSDLHYETTDPSAHERNNLVDSGYYLLDEQV